MSENRPFLGGEENKQVMRNPRADLDHHQKSITSRGSPLARVPAKFGWRPFPRSSVILFTEWQNEWKNDRERSYNIRLIGGGNNNNNGRQNIFN